MTDGLELLLRLADVAISLAVLLAVVFGFVRGDIVSRRSIAEIIAKTVQEVIDDIRKG